MSRSVVALCVKTRIKGTGKTVEDHSESQGSMLLSVNDPCGSQNTVPNKPSI